MRFLNLACGTKAGKTKFGGLWIASKAWEAQRLSVGRVIGPSYKQVKIAWRDTMSACSHIGVNFRVGDMEAHFPGGAVLEFRTGDNPKMLAGEGVQWLWIDEAAKCKQEVDEESQTTITQTKAPVLRTSTPRGRNWFHRKYLRGMDPLIHEEQSMRLPSSANPYLDPVELEAIKGRIPELIYRQEYLAEFVDDVDICFPGFRSCIKQAIAMDVNLANRYVVGVDLGKHKSYTVVVVLQRPNRDGDPLVMRSLERFQKMPWPEMRARVVKTIARYRAHSVIDATGAGDHFMDEIRRDLRNIPGCAIRPFMFTNTSKEAIIENLQVLIENEGIQLIDNPQLVAEFETFGYEYNHATRNTSYSAPQGMTDDIICALAMAADHGKGVARREPVAHGLWDR